MMYTFEANKKALEFSNRQVPLMQQFSSMLNGMGITGFHYIKVYYNPARYLHLNPSEALNVYYTNHVMKLTPVLEQFIGGEFNEFIWPSDIRDDHFFTWLYNHDMANSFFVRQCAKEYYECWTFSTSAQNTQVLQVYPHIRVELYRFIRYFNYAAASVLKEGESYLGSYYEPVKVPPPSTYSAGLLEIPWLYKGKEIWLSKEQLNCLHYISKGFTGKQAARELAKSHRTVEYHLSVIKEKLGVKFITELTKFYHENMECKL